MGVPETGSDLLSRLRRRDRTALRELAVDHGSALTRVAYLHLGDAHAAEDAAQETLLAAWRAARRTSDRTTLRPWLYGILVNICRNHLRSLQRRRRREKLAVSRRPKNPSPDAPEDITKELAAVQQALMQLDEGQRSVIVLRYERGLSIAETAEALGIAEGTVKSRTHSALQRLKEALGP